MMWIKTIHISNKGKNADTGIADCQILEMEKVKLKSALFYILIISFSFSLFYT